MKTKPDNPGLRPPACHQAYSGIVIAGTHSGVGKSCVSIGLLRLLQKKGQAVQPFKAGPDYIDTRHHGRACGRASYNLDSWMSSTQYVRDLFADVMRRDNGEVAIVEGMMGLFDGAESTTNTASTAEIADLLDLPVLLIIDGQAMARSAAALVKGYTEFDPALRFAGVIANRVNHPKHAALLKEAIENDTAVKFSGYLPPHPFLKISSRHLGLHQEHEQSEAWYDRWAEHIGQHIDIEGLMKAARRRGLAAGPDNEPLRRFENVSKRPFTVAIASDEAFRFTYPDALDMFEHWGGRIKYFSPLADSRLPPGADWIYFPGGYPELHLGPLSSNHALISDIHCFANAGKVVVGECGGLMYLGKSLTDEKGNVHPMAGLFDFSTSLENKKMSLGYRHLIYEPAAGPGMPISIKGHEFHFSSLVENRETPRMKTAGAGHPVSSKDGFIRNNCFAFYTHIYWPSSPQWLNHILSLAHC